MSRRACPENWEVTGWSGPPAGRYDAGNRGMYTALDDLLDSGFTLVQSYDSMGAYLRATKGDSAAILRKVEDEVADGRRRKRKRVMQ